MLLIVILYFGIGTTPTVKLIVVIFFPTSQEKAIHYFLLGVLLIYTVIILFAEFFLPDEQVWCKYHSVQNTKEYENPDYDKNLCRHQHTVHLLYMTVDECDYARRMLLSVIFGAIIGFERRSADRPAGIRTMGLVSLGSCFFTMCSMHAFRSSTMNWDAARVSAAIPSGVGFLGAGLIWKGTNTGSGDRHEVHGLATAAGVWLSAAIGVGVGGKLYIPSAYAVVLVVLVLRLGPRLYFWDSSDGSTTLYSDGMGGWDGSESNKDEETEDELDYDQYNASDNFDMYSTRNVHASVRSASSFVTGEELKWLSVKDSIRYGSEGKEHSSPTVPLLDTRSNHSLPPERTIPLEESTDNPSVIDIPGNSVLSSIGGTLHKVQSQPILKGSSKWTSESNTDESNHRLRRVKSEARYLAVIEDDKQNMSLRRSRRSKSVRRKNKFHGPIFVN
jgi:uncharacterized membrane protein YhiD involved in acid resistance